MNENTAEGLWSMFVHITKQKQKKFSEHFKGKIRNVVDVLLGGRETLYWLMKSPFISVFHIVDMDLSLSEPFSAACWLVFLITY